jgi:hypothetical protein
MVKLTRGAGARAVTVILASESFFANPEFTLERARENMSRG